MRSDGIGFPDRDGEPPLRSWWRWAATGSLVYWLDEDVFVSYREPGSPHTFGRGETAIVRRHSENVLVLLGDHRRNVEGLSTRELALYYDASPDKHHSSDDTWVEGLSN